MAKYVCALLFFLAASLSSFGQFTNVVVGSAPNDGTGDPLRTAFQKINYADNWLKTNLTTVSNLVVANDANTKLGTNAGTSYFQTALKPTITGGTATLLTNGMIALQPNTNFVNVGPYTNAMGAVASGTANFGQTGGQTAYEWLTYGSQARIRQNGTVRQLRFYFGPTTGLTAFKVFYSRKNASGNFEQVGDSGNLLSSITANAINTLSVAIPGIEEGDFVGGRMEWSSASAYNLYAYTGVSAVTNYATVNTATDTTDFNWLGQTATAGLIPVIESYMTAPIAAIIGDSIAAGHGSSSGNREEHYSFVEATDRPAIFNSPAYWLGKSFGWTYQNLGIGGDKLTNVNARIATLTNLWPKYAIVHVGRNDVTGSTTASEYTNHWNYTLSTLTSVGITPVVSLMLGGDDISSLNDPIIDTYNANLVTLVSNAYPNAILAFTKPYLNTNSPTQSPATNRYNFAPGMSDDTIHPSTAGYRRLAQAWIDALKPVDNFQQAANSDLILAGNGKFYAPSLSFINSPFTGLYLNASNQMSITVNAARKWDIDTSGNLKAASNGGVNIGAAGSDSPAFVYASSQLVGPVGDNVTPPFSFLGYRSYGMMIEESGPYLTLDVNAVPRARFDTNGNWLFPSDGVGSIGQNGTDRPSRVWIKDRLSLGAISGDVSSPSDGDLWRDDANGFFKGRVGGATIRIAGSPTFQGSGSVVFSTSPTITTPTISGDLTMSGSGSDVIWASDGQGDIGANAANRPNVIYVKDRIRFGAIAGDVTSPSDGDVWRDDSNGRFRGRAGGTTFTLASSANNLSIFSSTTSAQLDTLISDDTGSGALVFSTSPTLTTPAADSLTVNDDAYDATSWNGSTNVPTKNAIRDKIETLGSGISGLTTGTIPVATSATTIGNGPIITESTTNANVTGGVRANFLLSTNTVTAGSTTGSALFTFPSDTDTGMGRVGTDQIGFYAGSSGRMVIFDGSGNQIRLDAPTTRRRLVSAKTGAYTFTTNTDLDGIFNNTGATAKVAFTLPAATSGYTYTIYVTDSDGVDVISVGDDTIQYGATLSGAAATITSTAVGSWITITAMSSTLWFAQISGTWTP